MDYGIIITLAAFFLAVQLATRTNSNPLLPASIAVLIPYVVNLIQRYILGFNLFTLSSVLTVLIQFIVAVYIFKKLRDEDNVTSTILWSVGGFILIVIVIPYVLGLIRI